MQPPEWNSLVIVVWAWSIKWNLAFELVMEFKQRHLQVFFIFFFSFFWFAEYFAGRQFITLWIYRPARVGCFRWFNQYFYKWEKSLHEWWIILQLSRTSDNIIILTIIISTLSCILKECHRKLSLKRKLLIFKEISFYSMLVSFLI